MTPRTIQFSNSQSVIAAAGSPWASPHRSSFVDAILKQEYANRLHRFPVGPSTVRVVPAVCPSTRDWILGAHVLAYPGGRHLHPRTLNPGGKSVFDIAYRWLRKNQPEALFSKMAPQGYRLLADPYSICWILENLPDTGTTGPKTSCKLIVASAYDGHRGGVAGIGYLIWKLFEEKDDTGKPLADPSDPENCPHLMVDRVQPTGVRYPGYSLRLGRSPSPIGDWLARMAPEELDILRPLEEVVHIPAPEEEWMLLQKVMPTELVDRIRDAS